MKRCTSSEELREKLLEVLCSSGRPLTFDEIYSEVVHACGDVGKFMVRKVLARLVREGLLVRIRGDESRGLPRMVFECRRG